MGRVIFEDKIKAMGDRAVAVFDSGLGKMADDIVLVVKITIPFKSGDLQKEVIHEKVGVLRHKVTIDKEYAAFQERGKRADGSHVVRKYSTPNTGSHFLENGANRIVEKGIEYLKQANQLIKYT